MSLLLTFTLTHFSKGLLYDRLWYAGNELTTKKLSDVMEFCSGILSMPWSTTPQTKSIQRRRLYGSLSVRAQWSSIAFVQRNIICCHVTNTTSHHITSLHFTSHHNTSRHTIFPRDVSHHSTSSHSALHRIVSTLIVSYHIASYHITSYHSVTYELYRSTW